MRKFLASLAVGLALTIGLGPCTPSAVAASARPTYATWNDGILKFTWYWDPYARAWVLIRVELYFGD